ncbi:hypothetical protein ACFLQR_00620 [Verrucomicrobiota bacterium]
MRRKTGRFLGAFIVLVAVIGTLGLAIAQEPRSLLTPSPLELKKSGTVRVIKDKSGKVIAIKLDVTTYDIILDEGSKALEAMDGQKVKVIGTYKREGEKKSFTVKSVETVVSGDEKKDAAGKAEKAKPAEKAAEKKSVKEPEKKPVGKPAETKAEEPVEKPAK